MTMKYIDIPTPDELKSQCLQENEATTRDAVQRILAHLRLHPEANGIIVAFERAIHPLCQQEIVRVFMVKNWVVEFRNPQTCTVRESRMINNGQRD